ncbi:hypothetical protein ACFL9S_04990 [Erwinia sp. AnSW2-5]|uniref:hypothetical protein n=1 Tax=Erwinia sp. AnSW2-5 TaxID=3367692 RepID=UPI003859CF44
MLYFEKPVKWMKVFFNPIGVVSFFAGVYSLSLVDLFYFSEEISPDAFSAAFAGGALMLAGYTGFKVNKWLNSKINDAAFKKAEEFMNEYSSFSLKMLDISYKLRHINECGSEIEFREPTTRTASDIIKSIEDLHKKIFDLLILHQLFTNWRIIFKESEKFGQSMFDIGHSIETVKQIHSHSDNNINDFIFLLIGNNKLFETFEIQSRITEEILNIPFNEKFDFTSLAKKDS